MSVGGSVFVVGGGGGARRAASRAVVFRTGSTAGACQDLDCVITTNGGAPFIFSVSIIANRSSVNFTRRNRR